MSVLLTAALLWAAWAALLFVLQRRMIFVGQSLPAPAAPALPPGGRVFDLPIGGGERVEALYLPAEDASPGAPGPALIFTHGNAELVDDWVGAFRAFARRGVGVLLVEFPGYGRSGGRPGEATVTRAMVEAFDTLAALPEVDAGRIVAHGRSLGGGAAAALSRERPLAALVLESAFTGTRGFARRFLLPGLLVRDPFDNLGAVTAFAGPVLVLHGRRDEIIPFSHGEALARAAGTEVVSLDCAHNDCHDDWEAHVGRVVGFLRRSGVVSEPTPR